MRIAEPAFWPACVFNEKTTEFFYGIFQSKLRFGSQAKPGVVKRKLRVLPNERWQIKGLSMPFVLGGELVLLSKCDYTTDTVQFFWVCSAWDNVKGISYVAKCWGWSTSQRTFFGLDLFIISLFEKDVVLSTRRLRGRCRPDPHRSCQSVRRLVAGGTEQPQTAQWRCSGVAQCVPTKISCNFTEMSNMNTDLSDPVMSLKRVSLYQRWLKQSSAETFLCLLGWYRYYCWPHRVKFIIRCVQALISLLSASGTVTCAVFDDLFPGLPFFGQETRAELNRGLRGSFPNFPHLWLQQNLRTWPRNILAKEMDLSRIWNSPRLDSLFWHIATKKGGLLDCLLPSNSRSQRVMQSARGSCNQQPEASVWFCCGELAQPQEFWKVCSNIQTCDFCDFCDLFGV